MKQRIRNEVDATRNMISGNSNKMDNPLALEIQNIQHLYDDMKRILFLKKTRHRLLKETVIPNFKPTLTTDVINFQISKSLKDKRKEGPQWIGGDPKILNSMKIDLAVEKNEVEELIEIVLGLRIRSKENDNSKLNDSQATNTPKNAFAFDFSNPMTNNQVSKKNPSRFSKKKKKDFTPEERVKLLHQIALLVPLFCYYKSVELFGLNSYYDINDHPDFLHLKNFCQQYVKDKETGDSRHRPINKPSLKSDSSYEKRGRNISSSKKTCIKNMIV
jgi:hypothetical protein